MVGPTDPGADGPGGSVACSRFAAHDSLARLAGSQAWRLLVPEQTKPAPRLGERSVVEVLRASDRLVVVVHPFLAEFIGTAILLTLGNGVVANVLLPESKGRGGGWIVITFGWSMAVFVAVFTVAPFSGAHINPAVSFAMALAGELSWNFFGGYVLAQTAGAFAGAAIVFLFYRHHYRLCDQPELLRATFCTTPAIRKTPTAFFCEVLGTFMLVFPIFMMVEPSVQLTAGLGLDGPASPAHAFPVGLGTLGALPVALLVFAIGLSLGGTTGYAINPARDLGPRIAHAVLPIAHKGTSDWSYAWVPIAGPLLGGALATLAALASG